MAIDPLKTTTSPVTTPTTTQATTTPQTTATAPTSTSTATKDGFTAAAPTTAPVTLAPQAGTQATRPETYKIVSGDNLTRIARKFDTTIADLLAANPKITNPNLIYAGD